MRLFNTTSLGGFFFFFFLFCLVIVSGRRSEKRQLQYYPWCNQSHLWLGCESYVGDDTLLGVSTDDLDVLPFQVVLNPTPIQAGINETHTTAEFAAYHSVALHLSLFTDKREGSIALTEKTGDLHLRADEAGGNVVLWSSGTQLTIDRNTGCILINGSLPELSPCRMVAGFDESLLASAALLNNSSNRGAPWYAPKVDSQKVFIFLGGIVLGVGIMCCLALCSMVEAFRRSCCCHCLKKTPKKYEEMHNIEEDSLGITS